jgi:AcrR family transcriptional regulator
MRDEIPLIVLGEGPASPRQERSDAAANRSRILEAARALFATRGAAAVTMAEIAQAAGVGKGTLYRRFPDKGALCLALVDDELRMLQNQVLAGLRRRLAESEPALAQLCWFLDTLAHFQDEHMALLSEAQREGLRLADKTLPFTWQRATVVGLLEEAVAAGEASSDLDADYLATVLLAPLQGPLYRFEREQRGQTPQRLSAALCRLVQGLRQ